MSNDTIQLDTVVLLVAVHVVIQLIFPCAVSAIIECHCSDLILVSIRTGWSECILVVLHLVDVLGSRLPCSILDSQTLTGDSSVLSAISHI